MKFERVNPLKHGIKYTKILTNFPKGVEKHRFQEHITWIYSFPNRTEQKNIEKN